MIAEKRATSKERAAVFLKAAFEALHDVGGSLPLREVKQEVQKRVELTPRDREIYEKTGYVRWESVLHFHSIDCVKAGFIRKQGGRWHLTPEGDAARQLPAKKLLEQAVRAYRKLSNDIRNPAAGDTENPTTPVMPIPRPKPVRCWT